MAKIVLKKSSVTGKIPAVTDIDYGELAINYADGKLYYKKSDNTIDTFVSASGTPTGVASVDGNAGVVTSAQLLTSIKKEDGTGSGLDADLLDGQHGSYYLDWTNTTNKPLIPTKTSDLTNDSGYITSYTETDPIYTASSWYTTTNNSSNWNTAYSWGNHASAGYLLSSTAATTYQPLDGDLTSIAALAATSGILKKTAADTWTLSPVALGTETTGDYVAGLTAGTGISISGTSGEGWSPTVTNTAPNVTTDISITHNASTVVVNSSDGTDGTINAATTSLAGVMSSTDKTKLDGIAAGAEVNVNADWNAVNGDALILNKPTLGTAAAANTTDFATAAQGAKADTALQPAAIGVSVQAYDADLTSWAAISPSAKQDTLVSGTNIKTINGSSLLGSGDLAVGSGTLTIQNKTAAYTVVAGDNGTIINCTANTFTVSLTAAATLGAGFNCWVWNTSVQALEPITIDPNGSETIDGQTTLILRQGEGTQIICDGTKWQTGGKKTMRGYADNIYEGSTRPVASGGESIAIGVGATSSYSNTLAIGARSAASGNCSIAIGAGPTTGATATEERAIAIGENAKASSTYGVAIGQNSSGQGAQTAGGWSAGAGAMALGGSYASGSNSFAAAVANNTSSYGATSANAVAIGPNAKASNRGVALGDTTVASGYRSHAFGYYAQATAENALALNYQSTASGNTAVAITATSAFGGSTASGAGSIMIGDGTASAKDAIAFGHQCLSAFIGKFAYANGRFSANGDAQTGTIVLRRATTDATATVLTSDNAAAAATNQVILPNNSAYAFTGTIIARQQAAGGSNYAAWEIKGAIIRDTTAASTSLGSYNINVLSKTAGASAWTVALSADTTNGGLAITVTGAAATNIRWVATIQTSEVTYA